MSEVRAVLRTRLPKDDRVPATRGGTVERCAVKKKTLNGYGPRIEERCAARGDVAFTVTTLTDS